MEIHYTKQAVIFLSKQNAATRTRIINAVEEEAPDEIDLAMIREIREDPDCTALASDEEVRALLN